MQPSIQPDKASNGRWYGSDSMLLPIAICLVLLIGFCSFLPYLDRYPEPLFDEAVFNNPAVRVHDGRSFEWPLTASAPYGNVVWAYHGPFHPRLQVLTMRLLGVSQFACRETLGLPLDLSTSGPGGGPSFASCYHM